MNNRFFDFNVYDIPTPQKFKIKSGANATVSIIAMQADYDLHKSLLINILKAVQLDMETNIDLVILSSADSYYPLPENKNKTIFCFGVNPVKLGLNINVRPYKLYSTETYQLVFSHKLEKLNSEKKYKKALWDILQIIFKS